METRDKLHLENIVSYCNDISDAFAELEITRDSIDVSPSRKAVLAFYVGQIGEEAGKLSKEFTETHPEIEWKAVVGFRHRIVHAYAGVDSDILWDTVQRDIPELRDFCKGQLVVA